MASVNLTGSIYGSIVAKNKGIGGLASGLDTESIMEALTTSTRAKIGKQQQLKQLAQWKQTNYRTVATALKAFREKHLTFSNGTNIGSNSYFNTIKATSLSNKVKVTTTANSTLDTIKIDQVLQLATAHTIKGKADIKQDLTGAEIDLADPKLTFAGKTIQIEVDGKTKTIKLDSLEQFRISDTDTAAEKAAKTEGFKNGLQALMDTFGTKLKADVADSTGYVDPGDLDDPANWESIVKVNVTADDSKIIVNLEHGSGTIIMGAGADKLGFELYDSNRVTTTSTKIKNIKGLGGDLIGDVFKFSINGVEFTADPNETISKLIDRINTSTAGVRISYNKNTDAFEIGSKATGYADRIEMHDVQGNFLNELFGARSSTNLTSKGFFSNESYVAAEAFNFQTEYAGMDTEEKRKAFAERLNAMSFAIVTGSGIKTIRLNLDEETIEKIKAGDPVSDDTILEALNKSVNFAFNGDEDEEAAFQFSIDAGGIISMNTSSEEWVALSPAKGTSNGHDIDLLGFLGFDTSEGVEYTNWTPIEYQTEINGTSAISAAITGAQKDDVYGFDLTVNGVTKTISYALTKDDAAYLEKYSGDKVRQAKYLAEKLNSKIYEEFGDAVMSGSTIAVGLEVDGDGNTIFHIDKDVPVSLSTSSAADPRYFDALSFFNLQPGTDNRPTAFDDASLTLDKFGLTEGGTLVIRGTNPDGTAATPFEVDYDGTTTLGELVDEINAGGAGKGVFASIKDGRLVIEGGGKFSIGEKADGSGNTGNLLETFFGVPGGYNVQGQDYTDRESGGENAQIVVNGQIISQGSNTFVINGTQVEVLATTDAGESITINMASDPDELIDKLRDFINDYNALITLMNTMVKETHSKDYKYEPLTDEQRAELSTDEIEKWEVEAKKGIMRYDPTLTGIMDQMRSILYQPVGDSGVSLYDIGITTVSVLANADKNGHLEITTENEDKLRKMILNNPDMVREVFANAENGLAKKLDAVIDRAINTSSDPDKRGSLIAVAGTSTLTGDNTSTLDKKIAQYDEAISRLKTRLETEYARYWRQFTALETAIQNMNTQSSWLLDFGSNS